MNKYKIKISSEAVEDLRSIHTHIAFDLQARQSADDQLNRIRKAIYDLKTFPFRYRLVDWEPWNSMNIHQFPVDNYQVFYHVDEENTTVYVIRIFYSGSDIEHIINKNTKKDR